MGARGQGWERGETPGPPAELWCVHVLVEAQQAAFSSPTSPLVTRASLAAIAKAGYEPSSHEAPEQTLSRPTFTPPVVSFPIFLSHLFHKRD